MEGKKNNTLEYINPKSEKTEQISSVFLWLIEDEIKYPL